MKITLLNLLIAVPLLLFSQEHPCAAGKRHAHTKQAIVSSYHYKLMKKYDVKHVKLDVNVERTDNYISGNATTLAKILTSSFDTMAFELHSNLTIDSIFINGVKHLSFTRNNAEVRVKLLTPLVMNNMISTQVYYKGFPPYGLPEGDGFSTANSGSWGNRATWSLSEPFAAYHWWPCKQVLIDKADSSDVWITTDASNKAGSNGILTNVTTLGAKKRYEWKSRTPINYYLISIAVAQYVEYTIYANPAGAASPVMIQNYIYNNPATLPNFKAEIDTTVPLLEKFSELYGLYPFYKEKYGHCMAPFSGGMEHQTMTTQGFFEFGITAHELGHQWWGNNVTCSTWSSIWINEGFASYSEYLAYEFIAGIGKESHMADVHDRVMNVPDGSVFVLDSTNSDRIFSSRLTYDKGGAIIHTLRMYINDDNLFFQGLRNFQNQYKNSVAGVEQFKSSMQQSCGIGLNDFFTYWFYGEGFPTFSVDWNHSVDKLFHLKLSQFTSTTTTPLIKTYLELKLKRSIGDTIIRVYSSMNEQFYVFDAIPGDITNVEIDPFNNVINQEGTIVKDPLLFVSQESNETSIDDIIGIDFAIFPVPMSEELNIQLSDARKVQITILNAVGAVVYDASFNGQSECKINTSEFSSGLYMVRVSSGGQTISKKVVK